MSIAPVPPRHRSAWLEVDLDALRHNARLLRALSGGAALAPVVKADAYGHGLAAVAEALSGAVEALCVATLDEAVERATGRRWSRPAALPGARTRPLPTPSPPGPS